VSSPDDLDTRLNMATVSGSALLAQVQRGWALAREASGALSLREQLDLVCPDAKSQLFFIH